MRVVHNYRAEPLHKESVSCRLLPGIVETSYVEDTGRVKFRLLLKRLFEDQEPLLNIPALEKRPSNLEEYGLFFWRGLERFLQMLKHFLQLPKLGKKRREDELHPRVIRAGGEHLLSTFMRKIVHFFLHLRRDRR